MSTRIRTAIFTAAVALILSTAPLGAAVAPASADTISASDAAQLRDEVSTTHTPGSTVTLANDIDMAATAPLEIQVNSGIDLAGRALTTAGIVIDSGVTLTIFDSSAGGTGTLASTAADGAGIDTSVGSLVIQSGTVEAVGGNYGAGIGGGALDAAAGNVTVTGGKVTAIGALGAGIGGAYYGNGGTIKLTAGTVQATTRSYSAAIGSGYGGFEGTVGGGSVTIGAQAIVTVTIDTAQPPANILGGSSIFDTGAVDVAGSFTSTDGGVIYVSSHGSLTVDAGGSVTTIGRIGGGGAYGGLEGVGTIVNRGILNCTNYFNGVQVSGNSFPLSFNSSPTDGTLPSIQQVTVYAPTFTNSGVDIPTLSDRSSEIFGGWWTSPSGGAALTSSTPLSSGEFFYAHWKPLTSITLTPSAPSVVAGSDVSFTVEGTDADGDTSDQTAFATITEGTATADDHQRLTLTLAGEHTIDASVPPTSPTEQTLHTSASVDVTAAALKFLSFDPSVTSAVADVPQAFTVSGEDAYGNPLGDVTAGTTFQVFTDGVEGGGAVNGSEITLTGHEGVRLLKATNGAASGITYIDVTPGAFAKLNLMPTPSVTQPLSAGADVDILVFAEDAYDNYLGVVDDSAVVTSNIASDTFYNTADNHYVSMTAAGVHVITVTDGDVSATATFTIRALPFSKIALAPSQPTAFVGHSRTFSVVREDLYGNVISTVTTGVKLTTSSRHDTVKKRAVTFGATGTCTVTATALGMTTHLRVVVSKDVAPLSVAVPATIAKHKSTTVRVLLSAGPSGSRPTGTVRVYYTAKKYVSVTFKSTSKTSKSVKIPGLKAGSYTLHAKYYGSKKYLAGVSASVIRVVV